MLNLPNFLTLIRILTIPFFLAYLAYHRYSEALSYFYFRRGYRFSRRPNGALVASGNPAGRVLGPRGR